jgi:hypothetical protein
MLGITASRRFLDTPYFSLLVAKAVWVKRATAGFQPIIFFTTGTFFNG